MSRVRIGFFCPGNGTGGPWRYVRSILDSIDQTAFQVTLFADLPKTHPLRDQFRVVDLGGAVAMPGGASSLSAKIEQTPAGQSEIRPVMRLPFRLWAGFAKECVRLAKIFRQNPVDILHTQNTGCEESPVAAKLAGIKTVIGTCHVDSTYDLDRSRSGAGHRILEVVSNRLLDLAIAVSAATRSNWIARSNIPGRRVIVVHNGINPDAVRRKSDRTEARQRLGIPVESVVVGGVGRLEAAKGFSDLIRAAALLQPANPRLCVVIAGAGPDLESLKSQANELGVSGIVRFLGFQADVQLVFDSLDVFCMPSLCEALPFALLEAMASGLPAVATTAGGIPEVILHGCTGFLVRPREPAVIAKKLQVLISDPLLRKQLGENGRQRVRHDFTEKNMTQRTIESYESFPSKRG